MASVVQILALSDHRGAWTAHTLELLGDAQKLAAQLNGMVETWVLVAPGTDRVSTTDFTQLAAHGCRGVRRLCHARFDRLSSEAIAAGLAQSILPECRAVFLPGSPLGEEVAALLAVNLDTDWVANALTVSATRTGIVEIAAVETGGQLSRTYRFSDPKPVIVTIRSGVAEARADANLNPIVVQNVEVDLADVPHLTSVERLLPTDPSTVDISVAQRIIAGGRGCGSRAGIQLISALAEDLRASFAASRMAVDLDWAPPERQVGQTGKTVQPELYVACGISGASHHLAGMRDSKHIVVVNNDPKAPIHEVAHLSLVGDLQDVIPAIRAALTRRRQRQMSGDSLQNRPSDR